MHRQRYKEKSVGSSRNKGKGCKLLVKESRAQDNKPDDKSHQRRKSQRDQIRKMQEQISSAVKQSEQLRSNIAGSASHTQTTSIQQRREPVKGEAEKQGKGEQDK